ncbi:MAG: cytochrome c [Gammaproteobacteria bacterium]|nr:cytochrome c [Gammaproteobacteria bacterium]
MKTIVYRIILSLSVVVLPIFAVGNDASAEPNVPFKFALGKTKYLESCSVCHGPRLEGSKQGPPLMHDYYKPSHHNDDAFYRAALQGVHAHHWQFGDMPKIKGITPKDMDAIIPFIRWLQHEKGLF